MRTVSQWLAASEYFVLALATWVSIAISCIGVFFRYVLGDSLSWMEEMAGYLLLYIVTVGIATAVRNGSHLRVDIVPQFFPKTKRPLNFLANVFALVMMVFLLVLSYQFVRGLIEENQRATSLYWLPLGIPLIIMPVGYLATTFRLIEEFFKLLRRGEISAKTDSNTQS
jgi:TRAP-type C4-dicarboxylate transport system permease small subunit